MGGMQFIIFHNIFERENSSKTCVSSINKKYKLDIKCTWLWWITFHIFDKRKSPFFSRYNFFSFVSVPAVHRKRFPIIYIFTGDSRYRHLISFNCSWYENSWGDLREMWLKWARLKLSMLVRNTKKTYVLRPLLLTTLYSIKRCPLISAKMCNVSYNFLRSSHYRVIKCANSVYYYTLFATEMSRSLIITSIQEMVMEIDSQDATNDNSSRMTISINWLWVALQIDENRIFVQIETFTLVYPLSSLHLL